MRTSNDSIMAYFAEENSNILFAELISCVRIDLATAMHIVESRIAFMNNEKHFLVADVSNVHHISAEAKEFFRKPEGGLKNILGAAFIASNPVSALIANIFVKSPKDFQARFFSNRETALAWIYEYKSRFFDKIDQS